MEAARPWIVQKFGGTSIGKFLGEITGSIIPQSMSKRRVAVVCSALSNTEKSAGTTSLLLCAFELATSTSNTLDEITSLVNAIRAQHLDVAQKLAADARNTHERQDHKTQQNINSTCDELLLYLQTINKQCLEVESSNREYLNSFKFAQDRILSVGEALAAQILVLGLAMRGIEAEAVLLDNIVQQAFPGSPNSQAEGFNLSKISFLSVIANTLTKKLGSNEFKVPVITGFFGQMPYPLLKSIGRGYTDVCAALCAAAVDAHELQIWKEVDGIFSADPQKVPTARLLDTITPEEADGLTLFGSEVIHSLAIRIVNMERIPVYIKNVSNPTGAGTVIFPHVLARESRLGTIPSLANHATIMKSNGNHSEGLRRLAPTAVTSKDPITVITVVSAKTSNTYDFMAKLFTKLDEYKIEVEVITTSLHSISLAVSENDDQNSLKDVLSDLETLGSVRVLRDMAIISVIGHRMRNTVGVAGVIFSSLAKERINISLIRQGASETNISYVGLFPGTSFFCNLS